MPDDDVEEDDVAVVQGSDLRGCHDGLDEVAVLQVVVVSAQTGCFVVGVRVSGESAARENFALLLDDAVHGAAVVIQVRRTEVQFQLADHGKFRVEGLLVESLQLV